MQTEFWINRRHEPDPVRYKTTQREHRANKEFTVRVKKERFKKAGGKCELCETKIKFKNASFHHIMSLAYAFHYFPELTDIILKSEENCQVLCFDCHTILHHKDSYAVYSIIAANLIEILESWEKPVYPRSSHKTKKKHKRRELQRIEKERRKRIKENQKRLLKT